MYRRSLTAGGGTAGVSVAVASDGLSLTVRADEVHLLSAIVHRCRNLFALDADTPVIEASLQRDPVMRAIVPTRSGLRVPGAADGFELAVRAIVGQQITVAGAKTLLGRIVARFGTALPDPVGAVTHTFPSAERLAGADLTDVGLTRVRAGTASERARAVVRGDVELEPENDRETARAGLLALRGIGPWTAAYIAMRALHDSDSFPVGDIALRRALLLQGDSPTPGIERRWSPWGSYAALHLWASL